MLSHDLSSSSAGTARVFVRNCAVPLFVGIHAHEKSKAQPVIVHIEASMPLTHRFDDPKAGDMSFVMDYELLYNFLVNDLPKLGHVPLLESIAEHIIMFCFKDPLIQNVTVRLDKPDAFKGKALVSIEMQRQRSFM